MSRELLLEKRKTGLPMIFVGIGAVLFTTLILILAFLLVRMAYNEAAQAPEAAKIQSELKGQLEQIAAPPGTKFIRQTSTHKTHHGVVDNAYWTKLSFEDLRAHYDHELAKRGWKFIKEERVKYAGNDYGGKHVFYCNGKYTADLQYAGGQEQEFGWTYAFGLSWGVFDECR